MLAKGSIYLSVPSTDEVTSLTVSAAAPGDQTATAKAATIALGRVDLHSLYVAVKKRLGELAAARLAAAAKQPYAPKEAPAVYLCAISAGTMQLSLPDSTESVTLTVTPAGGSAAAAVLTATDLHHLFQATQQTFRQMDAARSLTQSSASRIKSPAGPGSTPS